MDHEIFTWLNSHQDYPSGLLLYDRFCKNPNLGRILRVGGATGKNRLTLAYELGKILRHLVAHHEIKPIDGLEQHRNQEEKEPQRIPAILIEDVRKDQKMIYKMLDNLHAILPLREIQERRDIAFQILDLDDRLKEITKRIAHYEKHGILLPVTEAETQLKTAELSDADLIRRQINVRTYITRYKRLVADAKSLKSLSRNRELLEKFELELEDITKRLNK